MAKERPILFSAQMVRAILADEKTQTRRIVAKSNSEIGSLPQRCWDELDFSKAWVDPGGTIFGPGPYLKAPKPIDDTVHRVYSRVEVGDRLWVKETWAPHDAKAIGDRDRSMVYYRADDERKHDSDGAWRSSMFMPRWASRVALEVTELRAQRLQDIGEADARAEGVKPWVHGESWNVLRKDGGCHDQFVEPDANDPTVQSFVHCPEEQWRDARGVFSSLWDSINGAGSWDRNDWVWVYTFKRVDTRSEAA